MAQYTITNVRFIEDNDYQFRVSFGYKELILTTHLLDRSVTPSEVQNIVVSTIHIADQKRSDEGYAELKDTYDNKDTLVVTG